MENNIKTHISLFGNTKMIMAGEATVSMDRLEKIQEMLYWNKNKIDNLNSLVTKIGLFDSVGSIRERLKFHHAVRERLKKMWNNELNQIKL